MIKDPIQACQSYAADNSDAGGAVMTVTLTKDFDDHLKCSASTWDDGAPVTKLFERNDEVPVHIPAGTQLMGVQYVGRATGDTIFEFIYGKAWFRIYVYDGTFGYDGDRLTAVI